MKKYIAHDGINGEREDFEQIEDARTYLTGQFLDPHEGYHPDLGSCCIYELKEIVTHEIIDSKENYKYIYEEDIPEDDNESEAWPYSTDHEEIWKHHFVSPSSNSDKEKEKCYISGKITGLGLEVAKQNFHNAAVYVRSLGYEAINPMELTPINDSFTWHDYMREDIRLLCDCGSIFMQENYNESKGAKIELEIARSINLKIIYG